MLSFSGQLLETVAFYRDPGVLDGNLNAAKHLLENLGSPEVDPRRDRNGTRQQWQGYVWEDVLASDVIDFLTSYRTHPEAHKVNSTLLAEFIQAMAGAGELTHWTVVLIGGREGMGLKLREDVSVKMLQRTAHGPFEDRYSIGRLMSPRDEAIDLDEAAWNAALALTRATWRPDPARGQNSQEPDAPNGPAVRRVRGFGAEGVPAHPDRGLLFLYALDPLKAGAGFTAETSPVIAFALSFPGSNSGLKVEYKINNVLWEQEYGSSE
jgi:hypothetical protein